MADLVDIQALYVSYSNGTGPYDGGDGAVWRYDITAGTWKDISPVSGSDLYFGYGEPTPFHLMFN